jgi:hypothetical protein
MLVRFTSMDRQDKDGQLEDKIDQIITQITDCSIQCNTYDSRDGQTH